MVRLCLFRTPFSNLDSIMKIRRLWFNCMDFQLMMLHWKIWFSFVMLFHITSLRTRSFSGRGVMLQMPLLETGIKGFEAGASDDHTGTSPLPGGLVDLRQVHLAITPARIPITRRPSDLVVRRLD
nr:uncharacterized protein LOC117281112 isoform X2 [Nicotiana tomentosiformis]